jgi:hypothetical protein
VNFRLPAAAIALCAFASCSDPGADARARIKQADVKKLRFEAAKLYKQLRAAPGPDYIAVKKSLWPASFAALKPRTVGLHIDGFAVALVGESGSESGVHIVPATMTVVPSGTRARYERIEDGIYWYSLGAAARK